MYVPTDAELEKMVFTDIHSNNNTVTAAEQKDALIKWIEGNDELRKSKGTHIKRNQMTLPFEHHFDFHFAQDFLLISQDKEIQSSLISILSMLAIY